VSSSYVLIGVPVAVALAILSLFGWWLKRRNR
jgi:hypothetical protein